jgi:hypothetical protein
LILAAQAAGMLLSPICSLLVIPTLARLTMPDVPDERVMEPPHAHPHPAPH